MTQLPGGLGGKALDRQGRKSSFFSAWKGCAEAPGLTESAREEHTRGDTDYQQGSSQLDLTDDRRTEDRDNSIVRAEGSFWRGETMLIFTCNG